MVYMFLLGSLSFSLLSFLNLDPLKSSLFLIFSLLSIMPVVSLGVHIWFSYFICMLFLSGIFVILVYFSSLSKINFVKSKGVFFSLVLTLFFFNLSYLFLGNHVGLANFYYSVYWFYLVLIIIILLGFMNFSSYFLSFSGALRKI